MVYLKKFLAIDRVHYISYYQIVLFALISLDREEEILVLTWVLVQVKDRANWL